MTKLYKYQKIGVKKIIQFNGRVLLADEMGLGKTLQALTYLSLQRRHTLPALVVCPASVKWVWRNEIKKHTKLKPTIINGKNVREGNPRDITIINYDLLYDWKKLLKKIGYKTLILDECHYIKSWKAQRTRAAISIGRKTPHIIAMSGTPLLSKPKELYRAINLLKPKLFPSYNNYAFRYCGRKINYWSGGWDDNGATHLDELHKKLKESCMIRRTKKQVLKQLPDKQRIVVPLTPTPQEYNQYYLIENNFKRWIYTLSPEKREKAIKAETLFKLKFAKYTAAQMKVKVLLDWIDDFLESTDEKLVVFAWHVSIINEIYNHYQKRIYTKDADKKVAKTVAKRLQGKSTDFCVKLYGATSQKERNQAIGRFQNTKSCRLFIGQLVAAGTGITLTAASNVLMAELDFTPANHIQAEDRCHRIGQKDSVTIYYAITKGTVEEKLCKLLQKKFETVTDVLDGKNRNKQKYSIYDLLINEYMKGK